jgi:sporulation protein YlmC with PRC-barrel domain
MRKLLLCAAAAILAAGTAFADNPTKEGKKENADVLYKASQLEGTALLNEKNESCGTVRDVVIDPMGDKVIYLDVGYGGTARIGEKHFAVPFDCVSLKQRPDKKDNVLSVVADKSYFDNNPGFDTKNYPTMGDKSFYGHPGQPKEPVIKEAAERVTGKEQARHVFRASTLRNLKVRNPQNEDLGRCADLVIQMKDGSIAYAIVAYGGTVRIGDKYFAVDVKNLTLNSADKPSNMTFTLDVPKSELDNNPGFDKNTLPAGPDKKLGKPAHKG